MSTLMGGWLDMLSEGELFEDRVEMDGMRAVDLIEMNIDITKNDQRTMAALAPFYFRLSLFLKWLQKIFRFS